MSFLFDPNVAYLLLVLGFVLGILALFTPGTGLLEIGALFAIALAGYGISQLSINWWALIILVVGVVPLFFAIRKSKQWVWLIPSVVVMIVGSIFLFPRGTSAQTINPFFAILVSLFATTLIWFIGRKSVDAMKLKPSQDLRKLIGQVGEARTDIKNSGTVYVAGEEWSARSDTTIHEKTLVKVKDRDGLVLIVEAYKETDK